MLAMSPVRSSSNIGGSGGGDQFLLEDISFDDLFVGFDDGDVLPDLKIDPSDIFADFSFSSCEEEMGNTAAATADPEKTCAETENRSSKDSNGEVEVVSARTKKEKSASSSEGGNGKSRKQSSSTKLSQGKKKGKVDWTPGLHRRFVQAVEQLGVDTAAPSRILELMGIDYLTRHNIASHLQKYRSHQIHLLAREAEATSWSHRRQVYTAGHGGGGKMGMPPNWAALPIIGFPPPMHRQPFRPLHVWGHPTVGHPQLVPVWPQPPWAQPQPPQAPPPPDPPGWHHPHFHWPLAQGTAWSPPPPLMAAEIFPAPPVLAIPPHPMFRSAPQHNVSPPPPPSKHSGSLQILQLDAQPVSSTALSKFLVTCKQIIKINDDEEESLRIRRWY